MSETPSSHCIAGVRVSNRGGGNWLRQISRWAEAGGPGGLPGAASQRERNDASREER